MDGVELRKTLVGIFSNCWGGPGGPACRRRSIYGIDGSSIPRHHGTRKVCQGGRKRPDVDVYTPKVCRGGQQRPKVSYALL
jgi:hypothetical protein